MSSIIRPLSVLCSIFLTATLLFGYLYIRRQRTRQFTTPIVREAAPTIAHPRAHVFEDEAMLRGPNAVIAGTVENISQENLQDLFVELELRRRASKATEISRVALEPDDLAPGEQGRYSITVPSNEWSGARLLKLSSSVTAEEIAYKSETGAKRPPQSPPPARTQIVRPQPRSKNKGEDFINTPETPVRVP